METAKDCYAFNFIILYKTLVILLYEQFENKVTHMLTDERKKQSPGGDVHHLVTERYMVKQAMT